MEDFRDGLLYEHPSTQMLYKKGKEVLQKFVDKLKNAESPPKRDVTDENLNKRLNRLSKEISPLFEKEFKELEDEIPTDLMDFPNAETLGIGCTLFLLRSNLS
ncbi:MAG: hypothetical protein NUV70_07800 [Caldiserica bacterium]|jgi:hypothetical protein|nr:hypothetical protein [Caldisericota bacterium]